jgi:hypothetical protein
VKLTKKLRIERAGANDMIEKLIKGMSKLVLTATQAVTEKVTTTIRQMPIYAADDSALFSRQTGKWKDFRRRSPLSEKRENFIPTYYFYEETGHMRLRYPKFNKCVSKGQIYLNAEKKVCLKRYSPDTQFMFFRKRKSQYKQVLAAQALRNRPPDPKRDKIACVRMIKENMKEDTDLSDLKCKMDI